MRFIFCFYKRPDSDDLIRFSCTFPWTTVVLLLPQIEIRGRFHARVGKHILETVSYVLHRKQEERIRVKKKKYIINLLSVIIE